MGKKTNYLIHETSPYLLQHACNPVDWYPWGEEALAEDAGLEQGAKLSVAQAAEEIKKEAACILLEQEKTQPLIRSVACTEGRAALSEKQEGRRGPAIKDECAICHRIPHWGYNETDFPVLLAQRG